MKPDIVAPNGVNTTVDFGGVNIDNDPFPNFFGTSAAAPHAAAVAALLNEARKRFFNHISFTAQEMKTVLTTTAIDMDAPGYDVNTGFGFIQADKALMSFSNPHPLIDSFKILGNPVPGDEPVTLVINGQYFASNAGVILRTDTIVPAAINNTQILVMIPPFMGNPPITVYNPPITPLGLDGGVSDSIYLKSSIPKNIKVIVNNAEKYFGEAIPAYSFEVLVNDEPLSSSGLNLAELGLATDITYSSSATNLSNIGLYFTGGHPHLLLIYQYLLQRRWQNCIIMNLLMGY